MHLQTRIVVVLATVTGAALLAAIISKASLSPPPEPVVISGASAPGAPGQVRASEAAFAATHALTASPEVPRANLRSVVEAAPMASHLPKVDEHRVRRRAGKVAQELALSAEHEQALITVLLQEQARRGVVMAELRCKPGDEEINALVRTELNAIRAWKSKELMTQFGADRMRIIMQRR